jgi:hypothetical protein
MGKGRRVRPSAGSVLNGGERDRIEPDRPQLDHVAVIVGVAAGTGETELGLDASHNGSARCTIRYQRGAAPHPSVVGLATKGVGHLTLPAAVAVQFGHCSNWLCGIRLSRLPISYTVRLGPLRACGPVLDSHPLTDHSEGMGEGIPPPPAYQAWARTSRT